jgi:hypothetical protein
MPSKILIKRSSVASNVPSAANLEIGELAVNLADRRIFTKDASATVFQIAPSITGLGASGTWGISVTGNAATVTNGVYSNGSYSDPAWITGLAASKISGSIANNQLANSSITLNGTPVSLGGSATIAGSGAFTASSTPPSNPAVGDRWLNTVNGVMFTRYNDGDSTQWVDLSGSALAAVNAAIPTYVSADAPLDENNFLWIQTGLGDSGEDVSLWVNI